MKIREIISRVRNSLKEHKSDSVFFNKHIYSVLKSHTAFLLKRESEKLKNIRMNGNKFNRGKVSDKWKFMINAPFKISDKCCDIMKKNPSKEFEKKTGLKPILGSTTAESELRKTLYKTNGCNMYDLKRPISMPLAFWTEDDIWGYIGKYNLNFSKIYNMGYDRTGCVWCLFGIQHDKYPNKIQMLEMSHPQLHKYCTENLGIGEVLDYMNIPYKNGDKENK